METLQGYLVNNPNLQELIPLIQKNNGDYRKTFFDYAEQKGIDPNEVLKFLK